jgi:hypothetical protein
MTSLPKRRSTTNDHGNSTDSTMTAVPHAPLIIAFLLIACLSTVFAYQTTSKPVSNRREWLFESVATATFTLAAAVTVAAPLSAQANQYCASGVGDGCDDLAEGNAFIQSLQAKSAMNKDSYAKV